MCIKQFAPLQNLQGCVFLLLDNAFTDHMAKLPVKVLQGILGHEALSTTAGTDLGGSKQLSANQSIHRVISLGIVMNKTAEQRISGTHGIHHRANLHSGQLQNTALPPDIQRSALTASAHDDDLIVIDLSQLPNQRLIVIPHPLITKEKNVSSCHKVPVVVIIRIIQHMDIGGDLLAGSLCRRQERTVEIDITSHHQIRISTARRSKPYSIS